MKRYYSETITIPLASPDDALDLNGCCALSYDGLGQAPTPEPWQLYNYNGGYTWWIERFQFPFGSFGMSPACGRYVIPPPNPKRTLVAASLVCPVIAECNHEDEPTRNLVILYDDGPWPTSMSDWRLDPPPNAVVACRMSLANIIPTRNTFRFPFQNLDQIVPGTTRMLSLWIDGGLPNGDNHVTIGDPSVADPFGKGMAPSLELIYAWPGRKPHGHMAKAPR